MPNIVITGATGQLGSRVVERVLEQVSVEQVAVSVRDPAKVEALRERGVEVRRGDYEDPTSLRESFVGAQRLLLISAATVGPAALQQHRNAIDAAREAGVERIVYTSHQAASPASKFAPAADHAATEAILEESGVAFTSLRDGFHAASALMMASHADGALALPQDGPVSWTTHDDLAVAAAVALTTDEFDGPTPPLTGPEALDFAAVAELLGLRRVVVPDEDYVAGLVSHGTPEPIARMLLSMFLASRAGEFDVVDPTLERLLGRRPKTLSEAIPR